MHHNVSITYSAQSVADLCAAIQAVRTLGGAPTVAIVPPAPVVTRPAPPSHPASRRGGPEPDVEAYQAGLEAWAKNTGRSLVVSGFRRWKEEIDAGLSRNDAARARMERSDWCEEWERRGMGNAAPRAKGNNEPHPAEQALELDENDL